MCFLVPRISTSLVEIAILEKIAALNMQEIIVQILKEVLKMRLDSDAIFPR
jgi:predicted PP-loop superfamily ATPase